MTDTNVNVSEVESKVEVKADAVKRINFSIDGLMDGIDLEVIGKACKDLTGEHDVIMDGEVFKRYVDAIAILRNAGILIERIKIVEKKLHSQIERGMVKNSKLVGNKWYLQATYNNGLKLDEKELLEHKTTNADAVREICNVAAGHGQLGLVTSSIALKPYPNTVHADVLAELVKYGAKIVESDPQIKPPTEIKVQK